MRDVLCPNDAGRIAKKAYQPPTGSNGTGNTELPWALRYPGLSTCAAAELARLRTLFSTNTV